MVMFKSGHIKTNADYVKDVLAEEIGRAHV